MSRRTERIGGELRAELARLLREEVTDPRVGLVTLTRIDVSPDLSHALVFWSALEEGSDDEAVAARLDEHQAGLESAASFLRRRAASALPLRRMPELRFRYDPSLAQGSRMLALLRDVAPAGSEGSEGEAAAADGGGADGSEAGGAPETRGPESPGSADSTGRREANGAEE